MIFHVGSLPIPFSANLTATIIGHVITLQWTQPSEPIDTPTSVSREPPSPGAECTTSPCPITSLSPSTEYVFTLTLNSGQCRINMSKTMKMTWGKIEFGIGVCRLVSAGLMYIHNSDLCNCIIYFC